MFWGLAIGPALGPRLAGIGNKIEPPDRLPALQLKGPDPVLGSEVGPRRADQNEVLVDEWRRADVLARRRARDLAAPQQGAGSHVEGDEIAVRRAAHEAPVLDGDAAVGRRDLM